MKTSFRSFLKDLKRVASRFDKISNSIKTEKLLKLSHGRLPKNELLIEYVNALLFMCAYPSDKKLLHTTEKELTRITRFLKSHNSADNKIFINSGLPFTKCISHFSHDFVQWLLSHRDCVVSIADYKDASFDLNEVLKLTLPTLERSETTAAFSNTELLEALGVKKQYQLSFIINELSKVEDTPYVKDHLYDGLGIYVSLYPRNQLFSRVFNRFPVRSIFYHPTHVAPFNFKELLHRNLPEATKLTPKQRNECIMIVKNAMALTDRETDPTTYLDEKSFRLIELEGGISIVIYGMIPKRQLPLESYIGYTLFKNGFPAAYGGSWVFGERADFGINILESFRGGESGYFMCQLLRVFKQLFCIQYFEVEAYQFGLDNPEGVQSGAFWFYYKYGFRSLDKTLQKISSHEKKKKLKDKSYQTPVDILEKFTQSNMALKIGKRIPPSVASITTKVTRMIQQKYEGNRIKAEQACMDNYKKKVDIKMRYNNDEMTVLKEVALWTEAMNIKERRKIIILSRMIKIKLLDFYKYQQLLLQFFKT